MPAANLNQLWAKSLVSQLGAGGVKEAVICPGSRSAPLALAFAEQQGIRTWSMIDERSAGFFALGLAKESGTPAALLCTSGTAAANFYPAVVEAAMSRVPLLVLTADRPPELHGWGALQSIPQQRLYGEFVRWFADAGIPEQNPAVVTHLRATASRALASATRPPRGPVHLNVPFREPLAPIPAPPSASAHLNAAYADVLAAQVTGPKRLPSSEALSEVLERIRRSARGLIVCGPGEGGAQLAEVIQKLSQATQFPVLAESSSQMRFSRLGPEVVSLYDGLLHHAPFVSAHHPEVILRFGGPLISKRLQGWLDGSHAFAALFTDEGEWADPAHTATIIVEGSEVEACQQLASSHFRERSQWHEAFTIAEQRARAALQRAFSENDVLTEPRIAYETATVLPADSNLVVSSSMPVRDVDAFVPGSPISRRVFVNRGANGIDGMVSTALGVAASSGRPTVLLTGDLAFLHDLGALVSSRQHKLPLTVVVVNNDGGGIFSFLPISQFPEHYEELFGTPHGLEFSNVARVFDAPYAQPKDPGALRAAVRESLGGGLHLIEVRTSREENPSQHQALFDAIGRALGKGPWA